LNACLDDIRAITKQHHAQAALIDTILAILILSIGIAIGWCL